LVRPTERWVRLRTWRSSPELAMGLDELLLEREDPTPVLRLYTWEPAALSLGYFQRLADVPAAAAAGAVVRRITGGGAIHHAAELTFSIAAPLTHPLYRGPVPDSYARVHALVAGALRGLGVAAGPRGSLELGSDRRATGMCFHVSTPLDLAWDGAKGVGSAQRRRAGRVLHHGSIKLGPSPFEPGIAGLASRGIAVDAPTLGAELEARFARELGIEFQDEVLDEPSLADALRRGRRYADPAFVARR